MFISQGNRLRSIAVCQLQKHWSLSRLSSSAQFEPAKQDESAKHGLGPITKSSKPPFLKNVLLGKFDNDYLVYPETVDLDELQQRVIQNVHIDANRDEKKLTQLSVKERVKGLFKSNIPLMTDSSTNESERTKIYELLDIDLQTALIMDTQTLVIRIISKFGTEHVKSKYLDKLISGEITGAFAMSEACTGSDPSSLACTAVTCESDFALTGEKEWVTNGLHADIYVVLATSEETHGRLNRNLSAFLVEKNSNGITFIEQAPNSLKDCGICKIKFDNTIVPSLNVLGKVDDAFDVASTSLTHNRFFVLTTLLNTLKKLLSEVQSTLKSRKQFPIALKDCELIQQKLSVVGTSIYALESLVYLHTGIADSYEIEMLLEAAVLQLFCNKIVVDSLEICYEILGGKVYDDNNKYMKLASDVKGLILACKTNNLLQLYVSLVGIQHVAFSINDIILKNRNFLNYPGFVFKQIVRNIRHNNDNPKFELQLYTNLHPSLKDVCDGLEYTVLRLRFAVETILSRYGSDCITKQIDMCRIADVLCDVYAMTAVLGRASRSYCTGIRFNEQEMLLANAFCIDAMRRAKLKITQIVDGGVVSNDVVRLKIGMEILNHGGYFLEHPLVRNIK